MAKKTEPIDPQRELFELQIGLCNHLQGCKETCDLLIKGDMKGAVRVLDRTTSRLEKVIRKQAERHGYPPKKAKCRKG